MKTWTLLGSLLLAACTTDTGNGATGGATSAGPDAARAPADAAPAQADAATPDRPLPDAAVSLDAGPCPVPPAPETGPDASATRSPDYPGPPYGIGYCETVAGFTFQTAQATPLSLADIRKMPGVKVIAVLESFDCGASCVRMLSMLNAVNDELQPMGLYILNVLVSSTASAQEVMAWDAKTGFRGVTVHGNRISGRGGITSGLPALYVIHVSNMKIQHRGAGFSLTSEQLRTAALAALASAPP